MERQSPSRPIKLKTLPWRLVEHPECHFLFFQSDSLMVSLLPSLEKGYPKTHGPSLRVRIDARLPYHLPKRPAPLTQAGYLEEASDSRSHSILMITPKDKGRVMYLLGEGRGLGGKEKDRTIPQSVKQYHKNLPEETQACHPRSNKKHHSTGTVGSFF